MITELLIDKNESYFQTAKEIDQNLLETFENSSSDEEIEGFVSFTEIFARFEKDPWFSEKVDSYGDIAIYPHDCLVLVVEYRTVDEEVNGLDYDTPSKVFYCTTAQELTDYLN